MGPVLRIIIDIGRAARDLLRAILYGWVLYLVRLCRRARAKRRSKEEEGIGRRAGSHLRCMPIPKAIYKRPDPLIYSQSYLMSEGIAVTWDNPDIQLFKGGAPVPSADLAPDTTYEVVAQIWNGSTDAPAVDMPVLLSYLDFGIGMTPIPADKTRVNLPVKGAPGHPAFAHLHWHTPATPGHYCLLVELVWADDANPKNNIGQENTTVGDLNSPRAQFRFPVRNAARWPRVLRLEADAYTLPERRRCDPSRQGGPPTLTKAERERRIREAISRHGRQNFLVPDGWTVEFDQQELDLRPGEQHIAVVDITAPDEHFTGRRTFNVNAFDGTVLVGGVTLQVEG